MLKETNYDTRNVWFVMWGDEGGARSARRLRPRGGLEETLKFARQIVPQHRVLPVVLEQNRPWWEGLLRDVPPENLTEQPLDRGSAPGILATALRVLGRDPDAILVLMNIHGALPSRTEVFRGIDQARRTDRVVMLPSSAGGPHEQARHEHALAAPDVRTDAGTVARASVLIDVFRRACPELVAELSKPEVVKTPSTMDLIFPFLPDTDFLNHVLAPAPDQLRPLAH